MRLRTRMIALLMILVLLAASFGSLLSVSAANAAGGGGARYTQKIVSVLYDNSGSMQGDKNNYALYALQMLMALLSNDDDHANEPKRIYDDVNLGRSRDQSCCR